MIIKFFNLKDHQFSKGFITHEEQVTYGLSFSMFGEIVKVTCPNVEVIEAWALRHNLNEIDSKEAEIIVDKFLNDSKNAEDILV